jgi:hypothetical protein
VNEFSLIRRDHGIILIGRAPRLDVRSVEVRVFSGVLAADMVATLVDYRRCQLARG